MEWPPLLSLEFNVDDDDVNDDRYDDEEER